MLVHWILNLIKKASCYVMNQPVRGGSFKVTTETMMHSRKKGNDTKTGYGDYYLSFLNLK